MGLRFLLSLLALFFLTGSRQQVSGHAVSVAHAVKAYTVRGEVGTISSSLEKAELFQHAAIGRLVRNRNITTAAEQHLPDLVLPCPVFLPHGSAVLYQQNSGSGAAALFSFLQSLLYPKHSFW